MPSAYIGVQVDARADSQLVRLFHRGQLVKTHPRQRPGGRHTDPDDLPAERVGYAMRDLERLQRNADKHGHHIGIYVFRLLDDQLPWTRMRAVYRLLNLVRRYDAAAVDAACRTALEFRRLTRLDLLVIDDFALKALDATTTVDFYELCVERHAKALATLVTSNRDPAEWLSMTSDQLLAQSAVDRLTGHAHTLILEGPSYRQRHHR